MSMLGDDTDRVRNVRAAGGRAIMRHGSGELVYLQKVDLASDPRSCVVTWSAPGEPDRTFQWTAVCRSRRSRRSVIPVFM